MVKKDTMTAAVFEKVGILKIKKVPIPRICKPDEVLIKVDAVSICGTDLHALTNPPAFFFKEGIVIGHECAGFVEEVGADVTNVQEGDKVVIHPNIWCGKCYYCRTGQTNLCDHFIHIGDKIDGAMAEYICVPERMAYKISQSVPSHIACLTEPLACVLNATMEVRIHPGENAIILGAGPIGLIFLLLYKAAGATVAISDVSEKRREVALKLGADYVIDPNFKNIENEVKRITKTGAHVVTDTVGHLLDQAIHLVQKGGHIVLFGINQKLKSSVGQSQVVFNEIKIHGTFIAKGTFPMAVDMIEKKVIPIEKLVSHRLNIEDIEKGFALMHSGEGIKVVIEMNQK